MIREALEYLSSLATGASEPKVILDETGGKVIALAGKIQPVEKAPPPRNHKAKSLDDIITLANALEGRTPVVWYDESSVVLVYDHDGFRSDKATFTLHRSSVFLTLESLAKGKAWMEQKDFVRLLRIDLASALEPVHLLNAVRKVKFENGATTTGSVQRDRESLGREITSRVEADGELPEEVTLMVSAFLDTGERERLPVRRSVEVDAGRGAFRLLPLPDALDVLLQEAVASIADRLEIGLTNAPSYYGSP